MTLPRVYQSPDGAALAVETLDGEFIELALNILGSWDTQGMIEVIPDSWVRLMPDVTSSDPDEVAVHTLWTKIRDEAVKATETDPTYVEPVHGPLCSGINGECVSMHCPHCGEPTGPQGHMGCFPECR